MVNMKISCLCQKKWKAVSQKHIKISRVLYYIKKNVNTKEKKSHIQMNHLGYEKYAR